MVKIHYPWTGHKVDVPQDLVELMPIIWGLRCRTKSCYKNRNTIRIEFEAERDAQNFMRYVDPIDPKWTRMICVEHDSFIKEEVDRKTPDKWTVNLNYSLDLPTEKLDELIVDLKKREPRDKMTVTIWNGRKMETVTGKLVEFNDEVMIFTTTRRWWLYYDPASCTGSFKTEKECKEWYEEGGR